MGAAFTFLGGSFPLLEPSAKQLGFEVVTLLIIIMDREGLP
ncbi:hypothetical protein ABLO26_21510 [Neobacillus sp. 179-J 1A1 HS]